MVPQRQRRENRRLEIGENLFDGLALFRRGGWKLCGEIVRGESGRYRVIPDIFRDSRRSNRRAGRRPAGIRRGTYPLSSHGSRFTQDTGSHSRNHCSKALISASVCWSNGMRE